MFVGVDINGHSPTWGPLETTPNAQGNLVEDFILEAGLEVLNCPNSRATFVSSMGQETWIDVSLATRPLASLVAEWTVLDQYVYSDHCALYTEISVVPTGTPPPRTLNWKAADWDLLNRTLGTELVARGCQPVPPTSGSALDTLVTEFSGALGRAVAAAVPVKRPSRFSKPWWSPTLTCLRREANKAYYRWRRTKSSADHSLFASARRIFKDAIRSAKRDTWRNFCSDLTPNNTWQRLKRLNRQHQHNVIKPL